MTDLRVNLPADFAEAIPESYEDIPDYAKTPLAQETIQDQINTLVGLWYQATVEKKFYKQTAESLRVAGASIASSPSEDLHAEDIADEEKDLLQQKLLEQEEELKEMKKHVSRYQQSQEKSDKTIEKLNRSLDAANASAERYRQESDQVRELFVKKKAELENKIKQREESIDELRTKLYGEGSQDLELQLKTKEREIETLKKQLDHTKGKPVVLSNSEEVKLLKKQLNEVHEALQQQEDNMQVLQRKYDESVATSEGWMKDVLDLKEENQELYKKYKDVQLSVDKVRKTNNHVWSPKGPVAFWDRNITHYGLSRADLQKFVENQDIFGRFAVASLNLAWDQDAPHIEKILNKNFEVSRFLYDNHPSIQCGKSKNGKEITSVLGLLNGICGVDDKDRGIITLKQGEDSGEILGFELNPEWGA